MEKQGLDLYFPSHRESDFWHKNLLLYNKSTQQILKSAHNSGIFFFIF